MEENFGAVASIVVIRLVLTALRVVAMSITQVNEYGWNFSEKLNCINLGSKMKGFNDIYP